MAIELKKLLTAYVNGALTIKYEKGSNVGNLGGTNITLEQAHKLCQEHFGWIEYRLSPFEIIEKTSKFMRSLKTNLKNQEVWDTAVVEFQNRPDSEYNKTFDRIVITCPRLFQYTIIYNMKNAGGVYVLYMTGQAVPVSKLRNLKQVIEYIQNSIDF